MKHDKTYFICKIFKLFWETSFLYKFGFKTHYYLHKKSLRHSETNRWGFDVHMTMHRDKFLIIKPTRCTNFSNLFLEWKLQMFWTVPLSIFRSFLLYTQQWYMSHRFADSLRAGSGWNSWWWTKEMSEICTVSFQI